MCLYGGDDGDDGGGDVDGDDGESGDGNDDDDEADEDGRWVEQGWQPLAWCWLCKASMQGIYAEVLLGQGKVGLALIRWLAGTTTPSWHAGPCTKKGQADSEMDSPWNAGSVG